MTTKKELKTVLISYSLVLALSLPVGAYYKAKKHLPPAYETMLGQKGLSNMVSTINLSITRARLDLESARNLESKPLPIAWVKKIKENNWTVDVIPWEFSYAIANNLNWSPNATLQLFMSYTPFLDQWSGQHYLGSNSPDVLIVEFLAIDGRHLLLDTPAVTRSLLRNYEVYKEELGKNLMLLKKRPQPLREDLTVIGEGEIHLDEWVEVPSTDHLLFGRLDMSLSALGSVIKTLFRIAPVYIDAVYESGRETSYRITPEVAKDGLLVNYLPTNQYEFSDLLKGCAKDRVVRFRVTGPGTSYYKRIANLRWERGNSLPRLFQQ